MQPINDRVPSGRCVCDQSGSYPRQHVPVVRPNETNPVDILSHLLSEQFHPDWSPDGSQRVFEHAPEGSDADVRQVRVSDANGDRAQALVTVYPAGLEGLFWTNPAGSPDGAAIAMVGYTSNASLVLPARSAPDHLHLYQRRGR